MTTRPEPTSFRGAPLTAPWQALYVASTIVTPREPPTATLPPGTVSRVITEPTKAFFVFTGVAVGPRAVWGATVVKAEARSAFSVSFVPPGVVGTIGATDTVPIVRIKVMGILLDSRRVRFT